uniref:Uncharacterized protein n=1 Tax=Parascaris univalens TaxID=6257 RepID=A0A915BT15_PARUN
MPRPNRRHNDAAFYSNSTHRCLRSRLRCPLSSKRSNTVSASILQLYIYVFVALYFCPGSISIAVIRHCYAHPKGHQNTPSESTFK